MPPDQVLSLPVREGTALPPHKPIRRDRLDLEQVGMRSGVGCITLNPTRDATGQCKPWAVQPQTRPHADHIVVMREYTIKDGGRQRHYPNRRQSNPAVLGKSARMTRELNTAGPKGNGAAQEIMGP